MMVNVANGPHGICVSVNVTAFVIVQRVHETYVLALRRHGRWHLTVGDRDIFLLV